MPTYSSATLVSDKEQAPTDMNALRFFTGVIMIIGLIAGAAECSSIMDNAQSAIHEVYAVATAAAYFVFAYILARAIENIVGAFMKRRAEREREAPDDKRRA